MTIDLQHRPRLESMNRLRPEGDQAPRQESAIELRRRQPRITPAEAFEGRDGYVEDFLGEFVVPWPEPHMWPIFAGAFAIHAVYKVLQAMTYTRGAYTVVYPVVRGTGPLFTVAAAGLVYVDHADREH